MPLELIIDGYNLIRQSRSLKRLDAQSLEQGREALLERLAQYTKVRGHPITVVFDGWGGFQTFSTRAQHKGITVVFTGRGETADEWIHGRLEEVQYGAVVTSDREIGRSAERAGLVAIPSRAFERRMEAALAGGIDKSAMDEEELEEEFAQAKRKGPARRLSKKEKKRRAILKKL